MLHMLPGAQQHCNPRHQRSNGRGRIWTPSKSVLAVHDATPLSSVHTTAHSRLPRQASGTPEQVEIKRAAKSARVSGQPKVALRILLDGVQQYPHDYHLIAAAASTAAKLGDAALAFQVLSPALQQRPHDVYLLTAAARAHAGRGNALAARQCLQTAAVAQPDNAVVLQLWGVLEASWGNLDTAVSLFRQALAADPSHVPVYVAWARLEADRGQVREARRLHQQGQQANPGHVPNLHAWAELECGEGQWLLGIKLLQAALQADRQHLPSWMALGKAHWALGDSAAACRIYQTACQTLGPVPELLNQWATLEQHAQRIPAARAVLGFLDRVLAAEPQKQGQQSQQQLQQVPAGRHRRTRQTKPPRQAAVQQLQEDDQQFASLHQAASSRQGRVGLLDDGVEQQLQELAALLNAQGPKGRAAAAAAAAAARVLQPDCGVQVSEIVGNDTLGIQDQQIHRVTSSSNRQDGSRLEDHQQQLQPQLEQLVYPRQQPTNGVSPGMTSSGSFVQPFSTPPSGLSQHVPALVSAAVMEQRAGNTNKALTLYEAALQTEPSNVKLLHALAQLHLKRGDRAAAQDHLRSLEQCDPANGFLCHSRGILAQQEGQLGEAREWFVRGTQAPGSQPALLNYEALAELQVFLGDASGARATLAAGLSSRRPTARFLRVAGLVEKRLGDVERAAQLLARAVAKAPRDYKSWLAWAVLERRRGDYAAAARCFQRGSACAPCNPHIWYAWAAMTWRDCRDFRAARRLYEQALTYCTRNAPLWMEWAMLEWDEAGNPERARQLFQAGAAVPLSYQHPPLYQAWAQREAAAGDQQMAERLIARSIEVAKGVK